MNLAAEGFSSSTTSGWNTACWDRSPDAAATFVLLHEGLGCVALWRDFPEKLAAATGLGVFAYSRAGYGRSVHGRPAPPARLHDARGARRAAARARRDRLSARRADRPQRRRLDRGDLCRRLRRRFPPCRAGAHRAAFLRRGVRHRRDCAGKGALRNGRLPRQACALARRSRQRVLQLERPLARSRIRDMGHHGRVSRQSPSPSSSSRAKTINTARCVRSRSRRTFAAARSRRRSFPAYATFPIARPPRKPWQRSSILPADWIYDERSPVRSICPGNMPSRASPPGLRRRPRLEGHTAAMRSGWPGASPSDDARLGRVCIGRKLSITSPL